MAATCGRRALGFSCASAKTIVTHLPSSKPANNNLTGFFSPTEISASRFSLRNLTFSRFPVELGGAVTLMPLHSATASALFTSLLSLHNQNWGVYLKDLRLLYSITYLLPSSMLVSLLASN